MNRAELSSSEDIRPAFRHDINALRAIAIISVVFYHFELFGFNGGFVGVDIFFVISGFLMANIIWENVSEKKFDIVEFYMSRSRRIIPALLAMTIFTLALGWFILLPSDYKGLGGHARDTLLFISNIHYLNESGYFDDASKTKWLLQTWSLSIEWQFYLLYPLILTALKKSNLEKNFILGIHLAAIIMSLIYCLYLSNSGNEKSFYTLQSRAWELLAGGAVFLSRKSQNKKIENWAPALGYAALLIFIFFPIHNAPWPGALTIIPVAATSIILYKEQSKNWFTNSLVAQWIGTRSYSIYLWHWPIVVFLKYTEQNTNPIWIFISLIFCFIIAQFSFNFIELPWKIKYIQLRPNRNIRSEYLIAGGLIFTLAAAQAVRLTGIPKRLSDEISVVDAQRYNKNPRREECLNSEAKCTYGGENIVALVFGDSHADAVINAVVSALPSTDSGVIFRGSSMCLFVENAKMVDGEDGFCETLRKNAFDETIKSNKKLPVIIINRTTAYLSGKTIFEENSPKPLIYFGENTTMNTPNLDESFKSNYVNTICHLARTNPVYIMRPIPEMLFNVPKSIGKSLLLGSTININLPRSTYHERHTLTWKIQDEAARKCGAIILDPLPYLCDSTYCYGSIEGVPLYSDDDHLSEIGNKKLIPMFSKIFHSVEE